MALKLLITYNVREHRTQDYFNFLRTEFLPRAQAIGLVMTEGWQTLYGNYPSRLLAFASQTDDQLRAALAGDEWDSIETKLGEFVTDYEKRIVHARPNFQFFIPEASRR